MNVRLSFVSSSLSFLSFHLPLWLGISVAKTTFTLLGYTNRFENGAKKLQTGVVFTLHRIEFVRKRHFSNTVATRPRFLNVIERKRSAMLSCVNTVTVTVTVNVLLRFRYQSVTMHPALSRVIKNGKLSRPFYNILESFWPLLVQFWEVWHWYHSFYDPWLEI